MLARGSSFREHPRTVRRPLHRRRRAAHNAVQGAIRVVAVRAPVFQFQCMRLFQDADVLFVRATTTSTGPEGVAALRGWGALTPLRQGIRNISTGSRE
jgi:hypothetical protein